MSRVQTPSHLRREYECIYLIDQALEDPQVDQVVQRYRDNVTEQGGKVVRIDNWGKRKLAYEIRKQQKATYVYMQFLATAGVVAEMERNMRLADEVIRWQTVVIDDLVDPAARPEASEVTKRAAEEDEDEGETGRRGPPGQRTGPRPAAAEAKPEPAAEAKPAAAAEAKPAAAEAKPEAAAEAKPEADAETKPADAKPEEE